MQWQDTGLVVRVTPFGEWDGIVHILTRSNGLCAGIAKGIRTSGKRSKTLQGLQVGSEVEAVWTARLEEQLGTWQLEPLRSFAALAFDNPLALKALQAICDLVADTLPERLEMGLVYKQTYKLLQVLVDLSGINLPKEYPVNFPLDSRLRGNDGSDRFLSDMGVCVRNTSELFKGGTELTASSFPRRRESTISVSITPEAGRVDWLPYLCLWERDMLASLGFGLDLSECAATGSLEDLVYISPRTGRAVSRAEGLPYHDKLLPLPEWLHPAYIRTPSVKGSNTPQKSERETLEAALVCLKVTGFFLNRWVFEPIRKPLPTSRGHFLDALGRSPYLQSAPKAVQEKP